jgi:hypothetical protein
VAEFPRMNAGLPPVLCLREAPKLLPPLESKMHSRGDKQSANHPSLRDSKASGALSPGRRWGSPALAGGATLQRRGKIRTLAIGV